MKCPMEQNRTEKGRGSTENGEGGCYFIQDGQGNSRQKGLEARDDLGHVYRTPGRKCSLREVTEKEH